MVGTHFRWLSTILNSPCITRQCRSIESTIAIRSTRKRAPGNQVCHGVSTGILYRPNSRNGRIIHNCHRSNSAETFTFQMQTENATRLPTIVRFPTIYKTNSQTTEKYHQQNILSLSKIAITYLAQSD